GSHQIGSAWPGRRCPGYLGHRSCQGWWPLSTQQINRYCIIGMAGIAAETQTYGTAEGGQDDQAQLKALWQITQKANQSAKPAETQLRWALLQAKTLLETQSAAYEALVSAMSKRASVAECQAQIEQHLIDPQP
ncbi:MAG: hypothetical protein ABG776_11315, partial [Cyanobacteria bacterium J06555_13]